MPHLELPDAAIYYEVAGAGRPELVFIHGGGCDHRDWRAQVEALGSDFTVLTLDLRGHGRSTGVIADCTVERWAADVNALIEALGIGPAVIVGHSLASRVAAEAAWQQPDNAAALAAAVSAASWRADPLLTRRWRLGTGRLQPSSKRRLGLMLTMLRAAM